MNENRAANRKWLAQNFVKKLKKCLNLKHCVAMAYFKRRCDLNLNNGGSRKTAAKYKADCSPSPNRRDMCRSLSFWAIL
ncbi:hypothetical protein Ahy_A06g030058 [Arachis hypogaea]|uniref:Uncharacterized protein n=1 Tax=Arachis hypogaea TaxID=3818 RepID=A0A445CV57_ARAHY|nr:hypothetical protein Ahy_A06g030058 [Arachis hypogaea]